MTDGASLTVEAGDIVIGAFDDFGSTFRVGGAEGGEVPLGVEVGVTEGQIIVFETLEIDEGGFVTTRRLAVATQATGSVPSVTVLGSDAGDTGGTIIADEVNVEGILYLVNGGTGLVIGRLQVGAPASDREDSTLSISTSGMLTGISADEIVLGLEEDTRGTVMLQGGQKRDGLRPRDDRLSG